jgi:hypothetical protein
VVDDEVGHVEHFRKLDVLADRRWPALALVDSSGELWQAAARQCYAGLEAAGRRPCEVGGPVHIVEIDGMLAEYGGVCTSVVAKIAVASRPTQSATAQASGEGANSEVRPLR